MGVWWLMSFAKELLRTIGQYSSIVVVLAVAVWPCRAAAQVLGMGLTGDSFLENTNLLTYEESGDWVDFNRLRYNGLWSHEYLPAVDLTFLGDATTNWLLPDESLRAELSIYRAYLSYRSERTLLVAGRQRIPFGVGRIWNPIDVFNPIDATAIEPDEREGTEALRVEYSLGALAIADATLASEKAAARVKGYLDFADCALVVEVDNTKDLVITGWELEGELWGTGIEARSEGGVFYDRQQEDSSLNLIIGAEYAFASSLDLTVEYLYAGLPGQSDIGLTTGYQFNMLTYLSCLLIVNLRDESYFLAPSIEYSLSDEMTLNLGYSARQGRRLTEFGEGDDTLWLRWFVHF